MIRTGARAEPGPSRRILVVKLSSLGDVVHAMPAVQDMRRAIPGARIDWVVERAFAPLARRCAGVHEVIETQLRQWVRAPLSATTRADWRAFRARLRACAYDAVIDLQGLTKSALVARTARLAPGGLRYAMANRTEGAGWEAPTRWVADRAIDIEPRIHAVERARVLCARALGYDERARPLAWGLARAAAADAGAGTAVGSEVVFIHGTSRDDKLWPLASWIALGRRIVGQGCTIGLPHGTERERERAHTIAEAIGVRQAHVWPRLDLGAIVDRMAASAGAIGVDSGLSHIATALDLPHVQIYNFDTAWRTGPTGGGRQRSVYARPTPATDAVWNAWSAVRAPMH